MRVLLLSVACLVALALSEALILPPIPSRDDCPQFFCTDEFGPQCSIGSCDEFRDFRNDCERLRYNCINYTNYKFIAKGPCIKPVVAAGGLFRS